MSEQTTNSNAQPKRRRPASANDIQKRKARRRKKILIKRLKLGGIILLCAAVIVFAVIMIVKLVGGGYTDEPTIEITSSGVVKVCEVSDFDDSNYDKAELKEYTKKLVDEYNETATDGNKVTFGGVKISKDKAYLKMEYSNYETYKAFTGHELYVGTVGGAKEANYDFQDTFSAVADKAKSDAKSIEDVTADDNAKVVLVRGNEHIIVPGTITVVSDPCTEVVGKSEIAVSQPDGNEDATVLTTIIYE